MSRRSHRKEKKANNFTLIAWMYLFLGWLSNIFLKPAVLDVEGSDDELLEPPSWAVIPPKLQEQADRISALQKEVKQLQKQEKSSVITGGALNLDPLEARLTENKSRRQAIQVLTEHCDNVMNELLDEQKQTLNVKNHL